MKRIIITALLTFLLIVSSSCSKNNIIPENNITSNNPSSSTSSGNNPSSFTHDHSDQDSTKSNIELGTAGDSHPSSSLGLEEKLGDLQKKGLEVIENQSFWTDFEKWGKVRFISGKVHDNGPFKLRFYLTDKEEKVLYRFPEFYGNQWPSFEELTAVAFKDVNKDGLKDIIIIAQYITGVGAQGVTPFPTAGIYFRKGMEFVNIPKLDDEINDAKKNQSVDMVLKFVDRKPLNLNESGNLNYSNHQLGFALQFPAAWKDKYIIKENEKGISVLHNSGLAQNANFFSITVFGDEKAWNEWIKTEEDGWPYRKLGVKNGQVFVESRPSDVPYDDSTDNMKKASDEYFELNKQVDSILGTFKFI